MEITLSAEQMAQITRHCERAYPHEGCGILLGRGEGGRKVVVDLLPTSNAREESARHNRYLIPPEELLHGELQAEARGLDVIGDFHSLPDHPAKPSLLDREHAWPRYSYLITSVQRGKATVTRSWLLRQDHTAFDEESLRITDQRLSKRENEET